MNKTVMITGASGFIGNHLTAQFAREGINTLGIFRSTAPRPSSTGHKTIAIGNIDGNTDWASPLQHTDIIVHLAARVHVMDDDARDPLGAFRAVNVDGTLNLARQAAEKKVKRFIFFSSIKVHGEKTDTTPFGSSSPLTPTDPYAQSKLEAEEGLLRISKETGLEIVIIRPPLVYGKGAGGNFARLRQLSALGIPLPFASISNRRSLVGIDNLCDFTRTCLDHPHATKAPLLVSDNQDISTPDLVRLLAESAGRTVRLFPFPVSLLQALATLFGRGQEIKRLSENLQIDCSDTMRLLHWHPPVSLEQGIKQSMP